MGAGFRWIILIIHNTDAEGGGVIEGAEQARVCAGRQIVYPSISFISSSDRAGRSGRFRWSIGPVCWCPMQHYAFSSGGGI